MFVERNCKNRHSNRQTRAKSAIISFIRAIFFQSRATVYLSSLTHSVNVCSFEVTIYSSLKRNARSSKARFLPRSLGPTWHPRGKTGDRSIAEAIRSLTRRDRVTTTSLKSDLANKFTYEQRTYVHRPMKEGCAIGPHDAYVHRRDPRRPYMDCPRDRPRYRWAITDWEADLGSAGKPAWEPAARSPVNRAVPLDKLIFPTRAGFTIAIKFN